MTAIADKVLDGLELKGRMNVDNAAMLEQVRQSIRRGHGQVWRQPERPERVVIVGSGPSLADTKDELIALVREGVVLVALNGAYQWCLEQNLCPSAQIVLDARASSARFVTPEIPRCTYYLASQCHPAVWDAVADYSRVGIFHALGEADDALKAILDEYYAGFWQGVAGGTTVGTRAIGLMRMLGYLRFDLFGIDSCWLKGQHHAFAQPENQHDERLRIKFAPSGAPHLEREFECAPWHAKQAEDWILMLKHLGRNFSVVVHGDGLLAYMVKALNDVSLEELAATLEQAQG